MGTITDAAIRFQSAYEAFRPLPEAKDFKDSLKPLKAVIKAIYKKNGAVSFPIDGKIGKKITEWQGKFAAKGVKAGNEPEVSAEHKAQVVSLSATSAKEFDKLSGEKELKAGKELKDLSASQQAYQENKAAKKEYRPVVEAALRAGRKVEDIQAKLRANAFFASRPADAKAIAKVAYYIANKKIVLEKE
ncbi:MAG: hypothetical protein K940chlam8_00576 [Chlamydiae bacterium]|nr:hypothetical protein [Chlamydiota bacterium]